MKATDWIKKLNLAAHPEGGYFKEVYRAEETMAKAGLPKRYASNRALSTSIYFLLTTESVSNFHRLNSDEIWHFHFGGKAKIHFINEEGHYSFSIIGEALNDEANFQVVIPQGTWFAAEVIEKDYILVGCTVAPGFEFEDFELADRQSLSSTYPAHQTLIARFTNK